MQIVAGQKTAASFDGPFPFGPLTQLQAGEPAFLDQTEVMGGLIGLVQCHIEQQITQHEIIIGRGGVTGLHPVGKGQTLLELSGHFQAIQHPYNQIVMPRLFRPATRQGRPVMAAGLGKPVGDLEFLAGLVMQIGIVRMGDQRLLQQGLIAALLAPELLVLVAVMADPDVQLAARMAVDGLFVHRTGEPHCFGQQADSSLR